MPLDLLPEVSGLLGAASPTITGQARTILGPLTTTFTQPPSCTIAMTGEEEDDDDDDLAGFLAHACAAAQGNAIGVDDASCWPSTSSGAVEPHLSFQGWGFYSPGTICPTGYAGACTATGGTGGSSDWPVQFALLEGETAVGCCPNGYACGNLGGQTCIQTATSATIPTARCEAGTITDSGTAVVPETSASSITAATLFAPMFQINWQSTDGAGFVAAPRTSPSLSQATHTSATVTSATGAPGLVGTQTVSTDSSQTGDLEMASTSGTVATTAAASRSAASSAASSSEAAGSGDDDQEVKSDKDKGGFPVGATIGVSVAAGLGATAVAILGAIMYHRRRQWKSEMLQGLSDDRMLQLDSIYEAARPKTFDTAGRETVFGLDRQGTFPSRPGQEMMYGPGQETAGIVRAGPRRSPQLVGGFSGPALSDGGSPTVGYVEKDGGLGPYYHRQ